MYKHVFVCSDAVKPPLTPADDCRFHGASRRPRTPDIKGRQNVISLDRLKSGYFGNSFKIYHLFFDAYSPTISTTPSHMEPAIIASNTAHASLCIGTTIKKCHRYFQAPVLCCIKKSPLFFIERSILSFNVSTSVVQAYITPKLN